MQPEFQEFLDNARAFEQQMRDAHTELERTVVTGRSGDGLVTLLASGLGQLKSVLIDPRVFEQHDVDRLQEAIAEAIRAAAGAASRLAEQKMGPVEINLS
ncbi:YbaB/EbfC family nucleoid-associated protein [Micromonospora sp. NPDC005367]|uniref:YbaB/EbfC family nucleoid-associated protein n=1 Tax=Micromonospora sp. NPDC005367 TaxID=3155590 RepID=UPI0033B2E79A